MISCDERQPSIMLNRRVLSLSASIVGRNYLKPSSYDVRKCTYLHKPFITLRPSSIFASFSSDSDSFFPEELTKEHDDHSTSNRVNAGTSTSASTGAVPVDTVGKRSKTTFANELTFNAERRNLNVLELLVYEDGFLHMNEFGQVNPILARIKIQSRHPREGVSKFIALEKWHNPGVRRTYDSTQLIVDHDLHKFQDLRKLLGHTLPELYANLSLHERRQLFSRVEVKATQEKHVPVKGKGVEMKELNLTETQSTRFADYLHRLDRPSSVLEPEMESPSCSFMHYIHDLPSVEQCDLSEADVLSDENPDKDILRKIDYRVDRINGPDRRDEGKDEVLGDFSYCLYSGGDIFSVRNFFSLQFVLSLF